MKTEPGEVTSPLHPSKKDEGLKRERECQEMNDSDEEEDDDEGDLLEEEEVPMPLFLFSLALRATDTFHDYFHASTKTGFQCIHQNSN